jgi:hypothetical protein
MNVYTGSIPFFWGMKKEKPETAMYSHKLKAAHRDAPEMDAHGLVSRMMMRGKWIPTDWYHV